MKLKEFFYEMRNTKYLYIILIIGVAIMLMSGITPQKDTEKKINDKAVNFSEEKRLEAVLSEISGAGDVSVMITYYSGMEKSLAYETKTDVRGETANGNGGESSDEKAVMADGVPVVLKEIYPQVKGVVVVADGAASPSVKQAICEAVSVSMGIAVHKICVLPKSVK